MSTEKGAPGKRAPITTTRKYKPQGAKRRHLRHDAQGATIRSRRLDDVKYRTLVDLGARRAYCNCPWGKLHSVVRLDSARKCWHIKREENYLIEHGLQTSAGCLDCGTTRGLHLVYTDDGSEPCGWLCTACARRRREADEERWWAARPGLKAIIDHF